ncbi:uncharacterized protein BYT42DRAFT_591897 [Radiomyces spectabilis]|uniref:uncharacterized protein n=1 Tax=Radiomyces spectabilis TaxID=64574 RepID=UPI0022209CEF|nr:uncharacterized protein BYT42DRAFT_591897 [Radiomyces spectabilis]KAI8391334.1 hypothetical protein BYT42DRAFT_591897 [Radiomyces spectabilis]
MAFSKNDHVLDGKSKSFGFLGNDRIACCSKLPMVWHVMGPFGENHDIFDRALRNETLLSSIEDLVTVLMAKCDYARRQVDWEDPDDEAVMDLRVTFEECLAYLSEGNTRYYAFIEGKRLGNEAKAREQWDTIIKRHGKDAEAWVRYIEFERSLGNYHTCVSLFKQAIVKRLDYPERLMDAWLTMEHEIGSVDSVEDALVRINHKTNLLTREWQSAIAEQQAQEERKKEKEITQKKKKAAHRAKQKEGPKKEAQGTTETQPATSASRKRKASEDMSTDTAKKSKPSQREATTSSEFKAPEPPAANRGRGAATTRGRRGTRLAMPSRQTQKPKQEQSEEPSSLPKDPETKPAEEKSNADFRAMLLGKK